MNTPTLHPTEARAHKTFTALMWALAHPGEPQLLEPKPGDVTGLETIAEALLDLETGFCTTDPALEDAIRRTGAYPAPSHEAEYLFHLEVTPAVVMQLERVRIGTPLYPDDSASIIIACAQDAGINLRLTGPGVFGQRHIRAQGVPVEFWRARERRIRFPLGFDVFLVSRVAAGVQVTGIPRSTRVEVS